MMDDTPDLYARMAKELFNQTWDLLDRTNRTPEEDLRMLGSALGSWAMWRRAGEPKNHAISDWQVSRVFAVLEEPGWAHRYAVAGLDLCREHNLGPFLQGYAWESVARAAHLSGDHESAAEAVAAARVAADLVEDPDDRQLMIDDLEDLTP